MKKLLIPILLLSLFATAQTKDALDKYKKAKRELDKLSVECPHNRCPFAPPNLDKAEKWLKEALASSPDYLDAQLSLADLYYLQRRFDASATEYAKGRDLDDSQKKLSRAARNVLLDQLGLAQAQSRRLDEAIKTYTSALAEDASYPLFEYNLACSYAEKGDLDSALPHLKKAWELKDNMPGGEPFPDPRKDSSFKKFWNDARFKAAVENMVV